MKQTFDNKDAYLHASIEIVGDDHKAKEISYKVRTDLIGYKTSTKNKLNPDGTPNVTATGTPMVETIETPVG